MTAIINILVFLVSFAVSSLAQSSIITTHVGPPLPERVRRRSLTLLINPVASFWTALAVFTSPVSVRTGCIESQRMAHSL